MKKQIAGYVCLVLGVAGLALPFLPGIALLLVGMRLLGPDHPVTRPLRLLTQRFLSRLENRKQ
ncbi:MAG: hypothetical protein DMF60_05285 [Acidobacteria bacterium]|nr:MAG: hypothetical protein DMF60_05285 [Acidobacteriota bacterium]